MRLDIRARSNGANNSLGDGGILPDASNKILKDGWLSKWTNYLKGCTLFELCFILIW